MQNRTWFRWLIVLPTALIVWGSIQLLMAFLITAPFYSNLLEAVYGSLIVVLKEFVYYAVAPFWTVVFGAYVAPKYNYEVSLVLAALITAVQLTVATTILFIGVYKPFWIIIGIIVYLIAITMACSQVKKDHKVNRDKLDE